MIKEEKIPAIKKPSFIVLDVGCRWGFADKFLDGIDDILIYGFDPDIEECKRLERKYKNSNITLVPIALSDRAEIKKLYITNEPACSSLYQPNKHLTKNYPALDCAREVSQVEITTSTLNKWAKELGISSIDYIKIDTQGSELDILKGATNVLSGVRFLEV